jgi:hypothetical protein
MASHRSIAAPSIRLGCRSRTQSDPELASGLTDSLDECTTRGPWGPTSVIPEQSFHSRISAGQRTGWSALFGKLGSMREWPDGEAGSLRRPDRRGA